MNVPIEKVFISHSSGDKSFVDRLVANLASRTIPVWYDKFDLRVGDSVTGRINEGLSSFAGKTFLACSIQDFGFVSMSQGRSNCRPDGASSESRDISSPRSS